MTGLYVHIPFCSVKCFYCDFAAFSGQNKQIERYLAALTAEAGFLPTNDVQTIYIGGGTPSELSAEQCQSLFERLCKAFPSTEIQETTFEASPESLDGLKIEVLKRNGVNRLSIGLQTADDKLLKDIGRHHSFAEFVDVFKLARDCGIASISVDLMYGLPGQSLESFKQSVDSVLALQPEHLSIYGLHVEDKTLFSRRQVQVDESLDYAMYEMALEKLQAAGFEHYEISNFAKPGFRSIHNINYWTRGEYLGLGVSAASFVGGVRSSNHETLTGYLKSIESGQLPIADEDKPKGLEALGEEAFLGLRLVDGFTPSDELRHIFAPIWQELKYRGFTLEDGKKWRLSKLGLFLANDVFKEFVPPFHLEEAYA